MSAIITPALVRRYLFATGQDSEELRVFVGALSTGENALAGFLQDFAIDRAALGMLAAAEMTHERAAMTMCDRPERSASYELDALERSLVAAAGVDPESWEKARGS